MKDKIATYTVRADRKLLKKLSYIASSEGRSANKEIEQLIKKRIEQFEKVHGTIECRFTHHSPYKPFQISAR